VPPGPPEAGIVPSKPRSAVASCCFKDPDSLCLNVLESRCSPKEPPLYEKSIPLENPTKDSQAQEMGITPTTRDVIIGEFLSGASRRAIARRLGIDRETVTRTLSQEEVQLIVHAYREAVLKIVPDALVGAAALVHRGDRQTIIEVLYGAKVLMDRHEVEKVDTAPPERTYDATRILFYAKYKRWGTDEEVKKFDKTLTWPTLTKGGLPEVTG
jgi:hypothetical protein